MPWRETSPMNEKTQFIVGYLRDVFTITELCEHYGISRKGLYSCYSPAHRVSGLSAGDSKKLSPRL